MKKISILVPCCNVEKYVEECLNSIQNQTYKNLEVICIDDGSKDKTGDIIDKYVAADNRFRVKHKSNSGYGDSMNTGLEMATGDYIGITESDDWIEPDMFETLLRTAEENNLDLTRCCWQEGPTGTEAENKQDWVKKNTVYTPLDRPDTFFQQPAIWVSLYRRDLIEEGRQIRFLPTPGASYQDTSFAFKVYSKAKRFMMIDRCLHHYRINPSSSVSSSGKVFCLNDEWEEMARWILEDEQLTQYFSSNATLANIICSGFDWNYHRLTPFHALRFLHRSAGFLRDLHAKGILCIEGALSKDRKEILSQVITDPLAYHQNQMFAVLNEYTAQTDDVPATDQEQLISVIVPCYNTAKYILQSLRSICTQSYRNLEIICVDDCSTDETEMLVRHAMKRDARIFFFKTESNSGLSASRNLGLNMAHGAFVTFVDGDDYLPPGALAALYAEIDDTTDAVFASIAVHYEEGKEHYGDLIQSDKHYYCIHHRECLDTATDLKKLSQLHVSACAKLWRTSVIWQFNISFPTGLLYEDANFYWKFLSVARQIRTLPRYAYLYQRHKTGSIMSSTFAKKSGMAIQHLYILNDMNRFFKEKGIQDTGQKILQTVCEPYFWFAYNNSPVEDLDEVVATTLRIIEEQQIDTSKSKVFQHLQHYNDIPKAKMFMDTFLAGNVLISDNDTESFCLRNKVVKYRKIYQHLIWLSVSLLVTIIALLTYIVLC